MAAELVTLLALLHAHAVACHHCFSDLLAVVLLLPPTL
jgi:hypothetical protein